MFALAVLEDSDPSVRRKPQPIQFPPYRFVASLVLMGRLRLIHWKSEEGSSIAELLRREGFEVEYEAKFSLEIFRTIRNAPPDAIVIDLSCRPSHGREVATALRGGKHTRQIPILFLGGEP